MNDINQYLPLTSILVSFVASGLTAYVSWIIRAHKVEARMNMLESKIIEMEREKEQKEKEINAKINDLSVKVDKINDNLINMRQESEKMFTRINVTLQMLFPDKIRP